jgi:hypothetical protein
LSSHAIEDFLGWKKIKNNKKTLKKKKKLPGKKFKIEVKPSFFLFFSVYSLIL